MRREKQLEENYPFIRWREPVEMVCGMTFPAHSIINHNTVTDVVHYGCRYCIAQFGIKGSSVASLPTKLSDHHSHLQQVHGTRAPALEEMFPKVEPYGL